MRIDLDMISTLLSAAVIVCWQHRRTDRRPHCADLRRLLADGETICVYVSGYGSLAEQQLIRRGARDLAVRAAQSARRGPVHLRPTLARLADAADELARSATLPSGARRAAVQDRTVRALAAAIDHIWADLTSLSSR
ncbi:hypothetical protein ACFQFC_36315 [Amorphoplanes digitatis]|uniref:Uncharacterized protein n=1 Tax=Actinoplanes digitatis TaxID=1868 RepID=A0A7W7HVP6_9ACTN|nr:hypothetical protein [Actinoplanes digitatis]MBB4761625.1 hypothetical protein [Actinoplanes digitatis]GID90735.1 hypothetical protein Adi01nite_01470 [Actinoplanes digitatis]